MKLKEVINKHYTQLNDSDKHILNYILNNREECISIAIDKLAIKCNVSRTTILRFTKKLGFKGYSEFKVFLKWEDQKNENNETIENFYHDLEKNIKNLKEKDLSKICEIIDNAERVFVYGTGTAQAAVAKEVKRLFLSIHKYLYVIEGDTELQMLVSSLNPNDVLIIISLSGEREYLVEIAQELESRGVEYISITKLNNNKLARSAKNNIYVATSITNLGNGNVNESLVLFYVVCEVLFREYLDYIKQSKAIELV